MLLKSKIKPFAFFFFLGLFSILAESFLLRELVSLSYGNEIIYSLGLGVWLLFVAVGTFLAQKIKLHRPNILYFLLFSTLFLFPFSVIFQRILVFKMTFAGQLLSFPKTFFLLITSVFPICLLFGFLFIAGLKRFKFNLNQAYFWETLGFFVGGIFFSLFLYRFNFPFYLDKVYPGFQRLITSPYQQIIITKNLGQENIFLSGQLSFSTQNIPQSEQEAGLILSLVRSTKKVLCVGDPFLASSLSVFPLIKQLEFLEIDPLLLEIEKSFLTPKIKTFSVDLRKYLNFQEKKYDLIIIKTSSPTSFSLNRFYTQQFYETVQKNLDKNGSFVLIFPLPTNYQGKEALRFARSIYQTFSSVFSIQVFLLDGKVLFVSNPSFESDKKKQVLLEKIYPSFSSKYFYYQLTDPDNQELIQKLRYPPEEKNQDHFPIAFFYQNLFWQTLFSFQFPKILYNLRFYLPAVFFVIVIFSFFKLSRTSRKFFSLFLSSFILMSLEVLLIFTFQINFGLLYSQLALLTGLVLLGMTFGIKKNSSKKKSLLFSFYFLIIFALFYGKLPIVVFWFLAFLLGFAGGSFFALISNQLVRKPYQSLIYTFDLLGAFGGSLLTGLILFPILGLGKLLFFLGIATCFLLPNAWNF